MKIGKLSYASAFMVNPDIHHLREFVLVAERRIEKAYLLSNGDILFAFRRGEEISLLNTKSQITYPYLPLSNTWRSVGFPSVYFTGTGIKHSAQIGESICELSKSRPVVVYADRHVNKLRFAVATIQLHVWRVL